MEGRPPDPYENDPTQSPNTLTEGNHITPTTVASKIDQTMKGTGTNITSASPNQATDFSGQIQVNLNHGIDSMILKTSMPTISATMVNPASTSDQATFSGDLHTGKHGAPAMKPIPNAHQIAQNIPYDHFPPLTSNFTQPHRKNYNPITTEKFGPPHVRSNAAENSQHDAYSVQPRNTGNVILNQSTALLQQKFNNINSSRDDSAKVLNPVNKPCGVPIPSSDDSAKVLNPANKPCVVPIPIPNTIANSKKVTQIDSIQNPTQNANTRAPFPPNVIPSYATRLRASQNYEDPQIDIRDPLITSKQGLPAVLFDRNDFMVKLATKCRYTLIGKFSSTMPKMEVIRKSLTSQLQIKGSCKVTHFNSTHVYIDLDNDIDHAIVWNKERIYIEGRAMRLLVWTPTFTPQEETPIIPIWVILPELPWHCYRMEFVSKLLQPVGRVLFFDAASMQKTRGSVAKVKVEIDLTKPRHHHVWIGYPQQEDDVYGDGRWQEVQYENVPDYCTHCKHQGHTNQICKIKLRNEEYQQKKALTEGKEKDQQPDNVNKVQQNMEKGQNQNKMNHNNSLQQSLIQRGVARTSLTTQQELQVQGQWQVQRRKGQKGANSGQQHNNVSPDKEFTEPAAAIKERVTPLDENVAHASGIIPVVFENSLVAHADQSVSQSFTKNKFDVIAVNVGNPAVEMELQGKNQIDASLPDVSSTLHSVGYIDPLQDTDKCEKAGALDVAALSGVGLQRNGVSAEVAVPDDAVTPVIATSTMQGHNLGASSFPVIPGNDVVTHANILLLENLSEDTLTFKDDVPAIQVDSFNTGQKSVEVFHATDELIDASTGKLMCKSPINAVAASETGEIKDTTKSWVERSFGKSVSHRAQHVGLQNTLIPTQDLQVISKFDRLLKLHGTSNINMEIAKKLSNKECQIILKRHEDRTLAPILAYIRKELIAPPEELAQKKATEPTKPRRVQPTRRSKSNSTRGK